jgi:hypothetical protein
MENLLVEIRYILKAGLKETKGRVRGDQEKMESNLEKMKSKMESSQKK